MLNPYLSALPNLGDEGDISLIGPIILLLGLLGIGAALVFFKDKNRSNTTSSKHPAIERVRNVISEIESDNEVESEDADPLDD